MKSTFYAITFWLPMCMKDAGTTDHLLFHCQTCPIYEVPAEYPCSEGALLRNLVQRNTCQVPKQANKIWKASLQAVSWVFSWKEIKSRSMIYGLMMNFYGAVHDNWANDESSWSSIMSLLGFWIMQFKEYKSNF